MTSRLVTGFGSSSLVSGQLVHDIFTVCMSSGIFGVWWPRSGNDWLTGGTPTGWWQWLTGGTPTG